MTQCTFLRPNAGDHVQRDPLERHYTPPNLASNVLQLLAIEWGPLERMFETAVGGAAFIREAIRLFPGIELFGCDIDLGCDGAQLLGEDRFEGEGTLETLHLHRERLTGMPAVGNPPFSLATEHVRALIPVCGRVAFILPSDVATRSMNTEWGQLFRDHPCRLFVIQGRPFGDKTRECALYVWDEHAPPEGVTIMMRRIPLHGPLEIAS